MKKPFLYLIFCGFAALLMACHKNNYTTTIPAPRFEYVKTDTKIAEKNEVGAQKEQPAYTSELSVRDKKELVLAADVKNGDSYEDRIDLSASVASKAVTVKLAKAPAVSKETSPQKLTFKERTLGKVLTKRIEKMQNRTKPKAGTTNAVALISGIAGLLGLVLLFTSAGAVSFLLGAAAIIMGFVGKAQIRRNDDRGIGWAITGIVSGILIFFILLLAVLFIASLLGL